MRDGEFKLPIKTDPVTLKLPVICADPVKGNGSTPVNPLPSPVNDPVNDPVLYIRLKVVLSPFVNVISPFWFYKIVGRHA